jgi:hypothetical protein
MDNLSKIEENKLTYFEIVKKLLSNQYIAYGFFSGNPQIKSILLVMFSMSGFIYFTIYIFFSRNSSLSINN